MVQFLGVIILGEKPASLHRYAYVQKIPINNIDFAGYGRLGYLRGGVKEKENYFAQWVDTNVYKPYVKPVIEETIALYDEHIKPVVDNINDKYVQPTINSVKGEVQQFASNPRQYINDNVIESSKSKMQKTQQYLEQKINKIKESINYLDEWKQDEKDAVS